MEGHSHTSVTTSLLYISVSVKNYTAEALDRVTISLIIVHGNIVLSRGNSVVTFKLIHIKECAYNGVENSN